MTRRAPITGARGFTLTELAVVFAIVALLLAAGLYTLAAQTDVRNFEETRRRLELARELVQAFAVVNGRLPCPATTSGDEAPAGGVVHRRAARRDGRASRRWPARRRARAGRKNTNAVMGDG